MSAYIWLGLAALGLFVLGAWLGASVYRTYAKRNFDELLVQSMASFGMTPLDFTRGMKKPEVDYQAVKLARKRGRAAYVDLMIGGEEVTLVAVDKAYLDALAGALRALREEVASALEEERVKIRAGIAPEAAAAPAMFKAPDLKPEDFGVIDGGKE